MVFIDLSPFKIVFPFLLYSLMVREVKLQKRCDKNRKRSKRRAIYCPIHGCHLDSVSPKYPLFADRAEQLQQRGMPRQNALMLVASRIAVPLDGEWIEAFWCAQCQQTKWYHVCKGEDRTFRVLIAPYELWQYVTGAVSPDGNPSVGEFTRKNARMIDYSGIRDFHFVV
ncbi:hypothetical protein ABRG53_2024 [Pseudanabaena sp. ABRG5-3]|nr:hypothetical protein [Pseudanabaena sp. ABRG5-3]BBC24281.1 hypothetical protein ABRG53_2024 [Pseudanabaena sp. ABRG5-3]